MIGKDLKVKLIDILPKDLDTIRLLIPKKAQLSDEKLSEMLELIKKY
ncbi:hypothetical protein HZB89_00105 [archaeon]|nr:hypothetical protein [archaeon]